MSDMLNLVLASRYQEIIKRNPSGMYAYVAVGVTLACRGHQQTHTNTFALMFDRSSSGLCSFQISFNLY
jgi:hypothetical protein